MLIRNQFFFKSNDAFTDNQIASQLHPGTDVLLTLVSSEILVGTETGGARLGHVLKPHRGQTQYSVASKEKIREAPEDHGKSHLILSWNRDRKRVEMLSRGFRKCFSSGGWRFFRSVSNFSARSRRH